MKDVVSGLKVNCEKGFDFLFRQIEEASDAIWKAKGGKLLYWQHIYHAFVCVDFFILPPGGEMDAGPGTLDAAMFREFPAEPLSKEAVRAFGEKKKAEAYAWIDGLDDADLPKKHEGSSQRRKMDVSNAVILAGIAGHLMYHVGCNDTTLREHGKEGVF